jgi:hypothetical protein
LAHQISKAFGRYGTKRFGFDAAENKDRKPTALVD